MIEINSMSNYASLFEKQDTIKIGDIVLTGKFKNRKATVKGFGKDKNNQPTIILTPGGERSLHGFRIEKLMPKKKKKK